MVRGVTHQRRYPFAPTTILVQPYTARLQKGGALLSDIRRLLLEWDGDLGSAERIVRDNVLALPSRARE